MVEAAEPVQLTAEGGHPRADIDERFEYDAPRFYDFDEGSPVGEPAADGWFDSEGPKGLGTPLRSKQEQQGAKPAQGVGAESKPKQPTKEGADDGKGAGSEWRRALGAITNTKGQAAAAPPPAKQRSKPRTVASKEDGPAGGGSEIRSAGAQQGRQPRQAPHHESAPAKHPALQPAASSPRLHSRPRSGLEQKSSEQLEVEEVQRKQEAAAALRRRNAQAMKRALRPPAPGLPPPPKQPEPPEPHTSKRSRMHSMETRSMGSPYKSMAEQIAVFEGRAPGRSRLAAGSSSATAPRQQQQGAAGGLAGLTVPMSPQFATKQRVRPSRFKPREVVEAEEMAAMPKFKARPLNKRIMQDCSGQAGLPHVDSKPPTVPEPFAFKTDQRAAEHGHPGGSSAAAAAAAGGSSAAFHFGAQGEDGRVTRSKAAVKKKPWTGQLTHPQPFALATDARGTNKRSALAEPHHEGQGPRPAKRRKAAEGPFQLATDQRGAAEAARIQAIRRQQEEQARQEAEFKALPLNRAALAGACKPPAIPQHELTMPRDVMLHSEARAAQRRQFDASAAAHAAKLEAERQQVQALRQQEEEEEVKNLRKQLGHKALPLPGRL